LLLRTSAVVLCCFSPFFSLVTLEIISAFLGHCSWSLISLLFRSLSLARTPFTRWTNITSRPLRLSLCCHPDLFLSITLSLPSIFEFPLLTLPTRYRISKEIGKRVTDDEFTGVRPSVIFFRLLACCRSLFHFQVLTSVCRLFDIGSFLPTCRVMIRC
jgi:hypothetical protein